jgi:hypothetical protein
MNCFATASWVSYKEMRHEHSTTHPNPPLIPVEGTKVYDMKGNKRAEGEFVWSLDRGG